MKIVMNESMLAEDAIASSDLGDSPYDTLTYIAKYYFAKGVSNRDVKKAISEMAEKNHAFRISGNGYDPIESIMKRAKKYKLIEIDYIPISQAELDRIGSIDSKQSRRLAFALLCYSKYWDIVNENNNHWSNVKDTEVMRSANINLSSKRQCELFAKLYEAGMIQYSNKVDNLNVRVLFSDDDEPVMAITDFRNLGYQYQAFLGEKYCHCENCGIIMKQTHQNGGRPRKYCNACRDLVKNRQTALSVYKSRSKAS